MRDRLGREVNYLRISVTDRCNLRCVYCMPPHGIRLLRHEDILSFEEICRVAECAARLGFTKLRLTGGEPLVRRGIAHLAKTLAETPGVREIDLTTNGLLLEEHACSLRAAGVRAVNVSLDTLRPERFREITRHGGIDKVWRGIEAAERAGFERVKLNVVVMQGVNFDEVEDFARLTFTRPLDVRFIELMALGHRRLAEAERFVPASAIEARVRKLGRLTQLESEKSSGPSERYQLEGAIGSIGFIAPVSKPFCGRCNRLRLTPEGKLRSCLLTGGEVDVRAILRDPDSDADAKLAAAFAQAAAMKPAIHSGCGSVNMRRVGG